MFSSRILKGLGMSLIVAISVGLISIAAADPPQTGATSAPRSVSPSPGCGRQGPALSGVLHRSVPDGKGRNRNFLVKLPPKYDASKPYALTFVFHGANGSSADSSAWGLQQAAGAADASLFIFPDGIAFQNFGVGWDDTSRGYDLPFFDNMLKDAVTSFCVDTSRVFAAGFSWGADFVIALICHRGGALRAAAVNSATDEFKDKTDFRSYEGMPCPSSARPAVRFEHAIGGDSEYPAPFFAATSALLQHLNSCGGSPTNSPSRPGVACISYTGCSSNTLECPFDAKLGHRLPPNWAENTWAFFSGTQ